jgi:hypothetical protein
MICTNSNEFGKQIMIFYVSNFQYAIKSTLNLFQIVKCRHT